MKRLVVILSLLAAITTVSAAPLSLADAVQQALAHNPEIAAADRDIQVVRAKLPQINALEHFHAGAEASYIHLEKVPTLEVPPLTLPLPAQLGGPQTITLPSFPLAQENTTTLTLTAQQPLTTGGRTRYAAAQVEEAAAALTARAVSKRREVVLAVARAYLSAVLAQRLVAVSEEAYAAIQQHVVQADGLLKAGMIPKYDLIRAQTELANADRRRLDARNQADLTLTYLMDLLGEPEAEHPTLTTTLDGHATLEETLPPLLAAAQTASSDLRALQARERMYLAGAQAARAELHPAVAIVAKTEVLRDDLPLTTPVGYVGVVMSVPLADGGMSKAKVAEQQALRERNASDVEMVRDGIQLEVRKYYLDLTSARKAVEAADKAVELATENLRLATRRFEVGQGTSIERVDAVLTFSLAEINRETARYQYDLAYYGLKKATGEILTLF
ncbi:MAG TPA: TolC family protein [Armatimonadota bacterium]|jgi:outer membrane protein TolC